MALRREWIIWVLLLVLAGSTWRRNDAWRNELTLWSDVAVKSPQKATPHLNLGNALVRRGALNKAEQEFQRVLEINPLDSRAVNGLAVIFFRQERFGEASRLLRILVEDKPDEPYFQNNLGVALLRQGDLLEAEMHFRLATQLLPGFADAYSNLGGVYLKQGRRAEAREAFRQALMLNSNQADALNNLDELERSDDEGQ